jgi:putative ABC transport system permease protein
MFAEALKFIWYDKAKMFGILFGIILSLFLVGQQVMICLSLLGSTVSLATFNQEYIWVVNEKSTQVGDLPFIDMRIGRSLYSIEGVAAVYPMVYGAGSLKKPDGTKVPLNLIGTQSPNFAGGPWRVIEGDTKNMLESNAIFLDSKNKELGSNLQLGDKFEFNGKQVVLRGLTYRTEGLGNSYAFSSIERARYLCNIPPTQASAFLVKWDPKYSPESVVKNISSKIPRIKARTGKDFRSESLRYFATNSGIVASFGLLVVFAVITGFAIVGLTMYSAVSDRIKDYGTLKAIGGNNWSIRKLILSQAALYSIVGFLMAWGLLNAFINATKDSLELQLIPEILYSLIGVTLFISVVGSLFGMRKITKLEPAAVFRG